MPAPPQQIGVRLTVPVARWRHERHEKKEAAMVKRYNLEGVNNPQGRFSHVGEIGPNARLFHLAGQTGARPDGTVASDFAEQARQVYRNLTTVLAGCSMTWQNVAKVTVFLTNPDDMPVWREVQKAAFGDVVPASTLLVVSRLARPEYRIEVEAIAAKD
jgi:enamine deaminase RidA (YjgF/YER057c/UK114 family)